MKVIETHGLTKKFGEHTAVNKINLKIEEGEIFGLLGPNGAGKTTTLNMLATLIPPTSGHAVVGGYDIHKQPQDVRRTIGFVFQDPSSDDIMTGRENLYLHAMMYGVDRKLINKRIDDALALVDLTKRQHELVKVYSGGMRRRLELARGLLHEPKVLYLDEPTLGLDPQTREHVWSYIRKLSRERKVTIIMTTHYMEEAEMLCDRVAIIDLGKIAALDTPEKLKKVVGGDVARLVAKEPNVSALKKLKYIKKIERKDGELLLTMENANKHIQEVLKVVGGVESIEVRSPTLNDVFLHYTGKEIRDEEAEGGAFQRIANYRSGR